MAKALTPIEIPKSKMATQKRHQNFPLYKDCRHLRTAK